MFQQVLHNKRALFSALETVVPACSAFIPPLAWKLHLHFLWGPAPPQALQGSRSLHGVDPTHTLLSPWGGPLIQYWTRICFFPPWTWPSVQGSAGRLKRDSFQGFLLEPLGRRSSLTEGYHMLKITRNTHMGRTCPRRQYRRK